MMSDTNGDALRIDELSNIMRMHAVDFKSHRADALLVGLRSENAHAVDLPHLEEFACDNALVGFEILCATGCVPASKRAGGAMYWAS